LVPPLTDLEYDSLKESVRNNGQWHDIIVNQDGFILDGHHRFRVCQELGIKPKTQTIEFPIKLQEKIFVYETNLKRRHLNDFQKAELGYNLEAVYRERARQRQISALKQGDYLPVPLGSGDPTLEKGRTSELISVRTGISPATYKRAKKIIEQSPESTKQKLRAGKSTIFKEYKRIQIEQKKEQLRNEKPVINTHEGWETHLGDFNEIGKQIPNDSIDLILTDPPYGQASLPLYEQLGVFANRVLRDGGSLVTFSNYNKVQSYNLIEKSGLNHVWDITVKLTGHTNLITVYGVQLDIRVKPLLWFIKGDKTRLPIHIVDYIESKPVDKALHPWQQSTVEAEYVIKNVTVENQTVLDPMMGSGTNGVSALKLNRQFIGIDIDPVAYRTAETRLSMLKLEVKQESSRGYLS
jgi:16S rRNA G966 N2-methylase RsmD